MIKAVTRQARSGMAGLGRAWLGMAGKARYVWQGRARRGVAWQAINNAARLGPL